MKKLVSNLAVLLTGLCSASTAFAGYDVWGRAEHMRINAYGHLEFYISSAPTQYCMRTWANFNFVVPKDHPQFPYYYGMVLASNTKGTKLLIANVDGFGGTELCDPTRNGYGMVLTSDK